MTWYTNPAVWSAIAAAFSCGAAGANAYTGRKSLFNQSIQIHRGNLLHLAQMCNKYTSEEQHQKITKDEIIAIYSILNRAVNGLKTLEKDKKSWPLMKDYFYINLNARIRDELETMISTNEVIEDKKLEIKNKESLIQRIEIVKGYFSDADRF